MFAIFHQAKAQSRANLTELKELNPKTTVPDLTLDELLHDPRDYLFKDAPASTEEKEDSSEVCFYVLGCAGYGSSAQKDVAELMEQIAAGTRKKPKFIVILGDNFYDAGVTSENDPAFKTNFYDMYAAKELLETQGIPCFVIGGNHDRNFRRFRGYKNGDVRTDALIAAQVKHTYLERGVVSEAKIKKYAAKELELATLQKWNMPRLYYSATLPGNPDKSERDTQLFFIDSSTYAKDFLNALPGGPDEKNPNNQANWLARVAKENPESLKFLFLHHPLHTMDKRVTEDDAYLYLSNEELQRLKSPPLNFTGNYNDLLRQILKAQGLHFDTVFSAHTHAMAYYNEQKPDGLCQVLSGGGGGNPHDRHVFTNRKNFPCFMKNNGFVSVKYCKNDPNKKITFDYYATKNPEFAAMKNLHLQFTNQSNDPVQVPSDPREAAKVAILRQHILDACELYYDNLDAPEKSFFSRNVHHKKDGSHRADDLINYFNRNEPPLTFSESVDYVKFRMRRKTEARSHSLETYLSNCMHNAHNVTYKQFVENPYSILPPVLPARKSSQPIPVKKSNPPGSEDGPSAQQFSSSPWEDVTKADCVPPPPVVTTVMFR